MKNRYAHVDRRTRQELAEYRDFLDDSEVRNAKQVDAEEPETDKAYRRVLIAHDMVRAQLHRMRRALFDMGRPLSPRGRRIILDDLAYGLRWYDPKPESTLIEATKYLLGNMSRLKQRWAELREAENKERVKP